MFDKNGVEIRTGQVVKVTGAFFKNDNGLYFVDNSPGDPSWSGSDYSLKKVCRNGRLSSSARNICFWPIAVFTNDRAKNAQANAWNREHSEIEVVALPDMSGVLGHFREKLEQITTTIQRHIWDFGEDAEVVQREKGIAAHYENVRRRRPSPSSPIPKSWLSPGSISGAPCSTSARRLSGWKEWRIPLSGKRLPWTLSA